MVFILLGFIGLLLWCERMGKRYPVWQPSEYFFEQLNQTPLVSIIIPARNEESTLPFLLSTLKQLTYTAVELIVVDDRSTDRTADVARRFAVEVVTGIEKPPDWSGKQWACVQGACRARGAYLLFTDADTWHEPHSLEQAVAFMEAGAVDMMSTLPFHDAPPGERMALWERLLGPFHLLLLALTAPWGDPKPGRVYAIGQYLMFRREAYVAIGGHAAVRDSYVEDLPLANSCLRAGMRYRVYHGSRLFSVRMYANFLDFLRGWRRNFRAGLVDSAKWAPLEAALMIAAMTGGGMFFGNVFAALLTVLTMWFLWGAQKRLGRFSRLGPLLGLFSLVCFCAVTVLAVYDIAAKKPLVWKGRAFVKNTSLT